MNIRYLPHPKIAFLATALWIVMLLLPLSASAQEFSRQDAGVMRMDGEITSTAFIRFVYEYTSWDVPPLKFEISSPGGNLREAMAIGRFIRDSRIPVLVSEDCLSACFFIYMGGVERSVQDDGRLGLHRPYFNKDFYSNLNTQEAEDLYNINSSDAELYLREMGTPQAIIEKLFKTSSISMFYISSNEASDLLGSRAPFYEEWIFAKCGEITEQDIRVIYSNHFLSQVRAVGAENASIEMVENASLAFELEKAGMLAGLLKSGADKLDCIEHGDNEHIFSHHESQKVKLLSVMSSILDEREKSEKTESR